MREPFHKARVYITTLLVIEILLGASILSVTGVYHHILGSYLAEVERKMLIGQFFNTYILGFQLVITYIGSMGMWDRIWQRRCSPNIILLLSVWMFFCFLILFCGCGTIWTLFICASAIENTAEASLTKGIDLYYTCPEWKLLWDGLQFHRECCGVHSYMDWMKAAWMPADALGEQGPPDGCGMLDKKTTTLAPYACCKHTCNACFENYIPRSGNSGIPFLNLTQINTEGCLAMFTSSMWNVIYILLSLVIIAIHIDIIMCCLTKYIVRQQDCFEDYSNDNLATLDDEGRPMVVVKCPPNVRCVSIEEEENGSACDMAYGPDEGEPCACFTGIRRSYNTKSETEAPLDSTPPQQHQYYQQTQQQQQQQNRKRCQCCSKRAESRFVH